MDPEQQDAGDFLNQAYGFPQQAPEQPPAQPIDKVLNQAYGIEPFTPADDLQLQKTQQAYSEAKEQLANGEIFPEQYQDYERQIMPRLTALSQAKQKSMQMGRAEQANISLEESARAAAMRNLDEKYHANSFMDKIGTLVDAGTGLVAKFYPHKNGGWEQVDFSKTPQQAQKDLTTTEMEAPSQGGGEEAAAPAQQPAPAQPPPQATASPPAPRPGQPRQRYARGQAPFSPAGGFQMTEAQRRIHEVADKGGGQVPNDIYEQAIADTEAQKKGLPHSFELTKAQRDTRMAQAIDMLRGMPEGPAKNAAIMSMAHSWVSNDQTMLRHELDKYRSTQEAQRKEGQRGQVAETKEQLKERLQDHRDFQKEIQDHYKPILDERHHMLGRLEKDGADRQKILDDYEPYHMSSSAAMKEAKNRAIKAREEAGLPIPGPLNAGRQQSPQQPQGDQDSSGGTEGGPTTEAKQPDVAPIIQQQHAKLDAVFGQIEKGATIEEAATVRKNIDSLKTLLSQYGGDLVGNHVPPEVKAKAATLKQSIATIAQNARTRRANQTTAAMTPYERQKYEAEKKGYVSKFE